MVLDFRNAYQRNCKASVVEVGRVTPCAPFYSGPPRRARSDAPYLVRVVRPASTDRFRWKSLFPLIFSLWAACLLPVKAHSQAVLDPWTPIFKGVDHARGTNTPGNGGFYFMQVVNVVRVDLTDPDIRLFSTPQFTNYVAEFYESPGLAVSNFLTHYRVQVAVNANNFHDPGTSDSPSYLTPFWSPFELDGLHISEGVVVSLQESSRDVASIMFATNNAATIVHTNWPPVSSSGVFTAVTGLYTILADGVNVGSNYITNPDTVHQYQPRTAIGLSKDRRYLFLMTIDGRQNFYSLGAKDWETAIWLTMAGAWDGVNMDGGGSTTLVMADSTGAPVELNSNSSTPAVGRERTVGSHLGIYAKPLPGFINDVNSTPSDNSSTVTWTTLTSATSQVEYGPSTNLGSFSALSSELVTNHNILLTGLMPDTGYFFRVRSQANGKEHVSSNFFFRTLNFVTTNAVFDFTNAWKYSTANLDGSRWADRNYDDSAWTGPSPGLLWVDDYRGANADIHQPLSTQIAGNPATSNFPYPTHYFRTHFSVLNAAAVRSLLVTAYIDDGAVFYLNGTEVFRLRMPPAPQAISYSSLSSGYPCSGDASCPDLFVLSGPILTNLIAGDNVMAVEVHNYDPESPDITFGAAIDSTRPLSPAEPPSLSILLQPNAVVLDWKENGYKLQSAPDSSNAWSDLPGPVLKGPYTNSLSDKVEFFRLAPAAN